MVMNAYLPELYISLGIYLPLIVVNCIILERAESFASKKPSNLFSNRRYCCRYWILQLPSL